MANDANVDASGDDDDALSDTEVNMTGENNNEDVNDAGDDDDDEKFLSQYISVV